MAVPVVLEMAQCPVCGAYSAAINTRNQIKIDGERHQLCSDGCRARFCKAHNLQPMRHANGVKGVWNRISALAATTLCPKGSSAGGQAV